MVLKLILAAKRLKINTESFRKCACGQVDIDLALKLNFKGGVSFSSWIQPFDRKFIFARKLVICCLIFKLL